MGASDDNKEKLRNSKRAAIMAEGMKADSVSLHRWMGKCDVDLTNTSGSERWESMSGEAFSGTWPVVENGICKNNIVDL